MLGCRVNDNPCQLVKELRSYGVKELSQMLGCRVDDNPCQLTKHTTPLSPWRGVGGEALKI